MKLAIIAGGKGTRLGLQDIPKPMVEIAGKPLLEHQINLAKRYGIKDIFILSGYLSEVIYNYFKNGQDFGVNICHIIEPYPLGTAGSVKLLEHLIAERFMVFYGDVVLDMDIDRFIQFDQKFSSIASIVVHPNDHPFDSDLVEMDRNNEIIAFHPKPHQPGAFYRNMVSAAVYILSPEIFDYIPGGVSSDFGKHIFRNLLDEHKLITAYSTAEYIKDMGTKDRFEKVSRDFITGKVARLNMQNNRKAIFLDRDGVINRDMDNSPSIDDFQLLGTVSEAINKINQSEFLSVVITNQPMIAKGLLSESELCDIHKKMETLLGNENAHLDGIYYCPHHPDSGFEGEIKELKIRCHCRKPEPGLIYQAVNDFNIDLKHSWMIGDRENDMMAGKKAGCRTIYLHPNNEKNRFADYVFENLLEAINFILAIKEV